MTFIGWFIRHAWDGSGVEAADVLEKIKEESPERYDELREEFGAYMKNTEAEPMELQLIPEEKEDLRRLAKEYGMETPEKLVQQFVQDLCGYRGSGSDEEQLAWSWIERHGRTY